MLLNLLFTLISLTLITAESQDVDNISNKNDIDIDSLHYLEDDLKYVVENEKLTEEKVEVKQYYECHCKGCILFDTRELKPTMEKLASNMDVKLYPYGRSKTIDKGDGTYEFKCKHGDEECYGNKLHACAIDYLKNMTKAVFFNSCMMDSQNNKGSDDEAADRCGKSMDIDSEAIKKCAKGPQGSNLLKHCGDETKKVVLDHGVPHILINGKSYSGSNFMKEVCAAFKTPPSACAQIH